MESYEQTCNEILSDIGGKDNIISVTHCMTRLRFNLKDRSLVNQTNIRNIKNVLGCQFSAGQFQIIIGQNVDKVYKHFVSITKIEDQTTELPCNDKRSLSEKIKDLPNILIDVVSGCITPILPIITVSGIIKLITAVLGKGMLNLLPATSPLMTLLTFVGNSGFYFFPIFVAWAASKKFNTSTPIALLLGAILIHPNLIALVTKGASFSVYGIPMTLVNYSSQFLPSILIVWVMSYVYYFFDKHCPRSLKIILVPACTVLVMLPLALCILGPLANLLGKLLADFFTSLYNLVGALAIGLIGAAWYFLVATGMHQALIALATTMIATMGYDNIILVGSKSGSYALMGLAIAYLIKCKKEQKAIASANAVTLIIGGISEPTIFSMLLRYKKAMLIQIIAGFVGGIVNGMLHVSIYFFGATNFLTGLAFGKDFVHGMIGCGISFVLALILGIVLGFDDKKLKDIVEENRG